MLDPTKLVDDISKGIDDNVFSEEERAEMLTRRLEIDANSDNQLAKMIRPLITLISCAVWVFIHVFAVFKEVPSEAMYSADAAFMTCIGFYFDSRRREKINQRKTMAAIQIDKQRAKIERADARLERRLLRRKKRGTSD